MHMQSPHMSGSSGATGSGNYISSAPSSGLCTPLQLELSCDGLKSKDLIGKSDPQIIVSVRDVRTMKWRIVGKTEVIKNNNSPHFAKRIEIDHYFDQRQDLRFKIVDKDSASDDEALGEVKSSLGEILAGGASSFKIAHRLLDLVNKIMDGKNLGTLVVRAHQVGSGLGRSRVRVSLSAKKLDRADGPLSKSDPYYKIEQIVGSGAAGISVLCQSEVIKNSLSPVWKPAEFELQLYGKQPEQVGIRVSLWDHDSHGQHDSLGAVLTNLGGLSPMSVHYIINEKKRAKKGNKYVNSGELIVNGMQITPLPSHLTYLQGGLRLRFTAAVDFTESNGPITKPGTLHYTDGVTPSLYSQALSAIGYVLSPYCAGQFEAFGFGAEIPSSQSAQFDFPLNLQGGGDPRVLGVEGLIAAYNSSVQSAVQAGPTNFCPILSRVLKSSILPAPPSQHDQHYSVLLIITNGAISDMAASKRKIVELSRTAPVSVVIVGVGSADFRSMQELDDGEGGAIVQFVHYQLGISEDDLTTRVLAEIPNALVDAMVKRNIQPNTVAVAAPSPQMY
jgi:hypothetical protein